jgi:hypothetical protein
MAAQDDSTNQGEGDYQAARRYVKRARKYVDKAEVSRDARRAAPRSAREAQALLAAERAAGARAKSTPKSR